MTFLRWLFHWHRWENVSGFKFIREYRCVKCGESQWRGPVY